MPNTDPPTQTQQTPASSARNQADAAFILTLAGLGWELFGLGAFGGLPVPLLLPLLAIFALLLTATLQTQHRLRHITPTPQSPTVQRVFKQAIAFEFVVIVLAVVITSILHKTAFILPVVALAVGLHFLPLARVLHRPLYYVTGGALCLLGVGVPLLVPAQIGTGHIAGWQLVLGLLGGVVVWLTTIALLVRSRTGAGV